MGKDLNRQFAHTSKDNGPQTFENMYKHIWSQRSVRSKSGVPGGDLDWLLERGKDINEQLTQRE